MDFADAAAAAISPLAQALFDVENVERVFLGADFISITKSDGDWQHLKPAILGVIMDHFVAEKPVVIASDASGTSDAVEGRGAGYSEQDEEIVEQIIELIDTRVRPAVARDGGDIVFNHYEDGVVYLHMRGACAGCPSSTFTLKSGIENLLKHYVPEVIRVEQVESM